MGHGLEDLLVGIAAEGGVAAEEDVHDDADGPEVRGSGVVLLDHLRRHVIRGAYPRLHGAVPLRRPRQPEIDELQRGLLHVLLVHKEEVLGLDVAVHDLPLVEVEQSGEDLLHHTSCLGLSEGSQLEDLIKKLSPLTQLHHKVDEPCVLEDLVEPDDIRMIRLLHQRDLALQALPLAHPLLENGLDGPGELGVLVHRLAHRAEPPRADRGGLHVIVVHDQPGGPGDETSPTEGAHARGVRAGDLGRGRGGLLLCWTLGHDRMASTGHFHPKS
mmetsp:Transcript_84081/g.224757  ORF Transcript_84081/g.224757 Transcript_84081/m.224757 type:complete len:272 (-) Transcript_84081:7-822(-)